jgi:hypothetical protein
VRKKFLVLKDEVFPHLHSDVGIEGYGVKAPQIVDSCDVCLVSKGIRTALFLCQSILQCSLPPRLNNFVLKFRDINCSATAVEILLHTEVLCLSAISQ